jgi:phenylacetate-CoA ligase
VGRVVATDLSNHATPLIRYDTGDHAERGGPCSCGRGLPTLGRVLGRTRNLATAPGGGRFWPSLGFKRFREVAPVRQYRFVQHAADRIEAQLWVERPVSAAEEAALAAVIRAALGYRYRIDFSYTDRRIAPDPSGKFDEFINRIAMP